MPDLTTLFNKMSVSKNDETGNETSSPQPSIFCSIGSETTSLSDTEIRTNLNSFLDAMGSRDDVLILPPDFTRFHSQAGKITRFISEYYKFIPTNGDDQDETKDDKNDNEEKEFQPKGKKAKIDDFSTSPAIQIPKIEILPALGTHVPMKKTQIETMFGKELASKEPNPFLVHDWRNDVITIGHAPSKMVSDATNGQVNQPWPAQLNKKVWAKRKTQSDGNCKNKPPLILSIGQVVPHEVMGMANFNKNLFVGVGGVEAINLSHFIGAVHGMEKMSLSNV